ncbi:hypothetical protein Tco_0946770 [Tanacetum coccineum]
MSAADQQSNDEGRLGRGAYIQLATTVTHGVLPPFMLSFWYEHLGLHGEEIYCIDVTVLVVKLLIRLDVGFSDNALGKNTFIIYEANYCRKCGDDEKSNNARTQQSTIEMHDDDERGCNDEEVALELVND